MFSILGKLAKADGSVSQEELAIVERFLNSMPVSAQEKAFARQVFNESKSAPYTIDDFATQLYTISRQQPALLVSFLDVLFQVAAADGRLDAAEEAALRRVKDIFRISDQQFDNLKASYFKDVEKYYRRLNCTAQSSNEDIKRSYKKLVKDFHPDTIVSKGLPEEFIEFATTRFREIQEAYENVRKERGF
jgi:DnaJ like chaperone protein